MQNVHFIAIGGSAMHNLAIALHRKGLTITGSDDEIVDPSKTRLANLGLLPEKMGWFPEKLNSSIDAVILGMHAREDNPELIRARELGLKVYSYPEFIYEQTKDKVRVVVGGSHGKTTVTSMIMHVLNKAGIRHDYLVGAQLEGYDCMVGLSKESAVAILEGDEYLASPIDRRPKFHLYHPNIAVLTGVAWDHINVFPTWENYVDQFRKFISLIDPKGFLAYCAADETLVSLAKEFPDLDKKGYSVPSHQIFNGVTYLMKEDRSEFPLEIFGDHNLMNLEAARAVCTRIGVTNDDFNTYISSFKGASRRLEKVADNGSVTVFRDFAHSPSKLAATLSAVRKQFPERKLVAAMELHTFSSLNQEFLKEYKGAMDGADVGMVYFNPHTIAHKKLEPISKEQVKNAFGNDHLFIFNESEEVRNKVIEETQAGSVVLLMSSGNFDGIDLVAFGKELAK